MPRRRTDEDYQRGLDDLDRKAAQIAARREQLEARQKTEYRKRSTRAKRVLGDALLKYGSDKSGVAITLPELLQQYIPVSRDREVAAWAIARLAKAMSGAIPDESVVQAEGGLGAAICAGVQIAGARPPLDSDRLIQWRRRQEQARIILGGAVLRRQTRRPDTPFILAELIDEDVVREVDRLALIRAFQGNPKTPEQAETANQGSS